MDVRIYTFVRASIRRLRRLVAKTTATKKSDITAAITNGVHL